MNRFKFKLWFCSLLPTILFLLSFTLFIFTYLNPVLIAYQLQNYFPKKYIKYLLFVEVFALMQPHFNKINPAEIEFLRPLDELMKVYAQNDKAYFCQLLNRKKDLIQNLMSIGIDHQKYFLFLTQVFKSQSPQKQFARIDLKLLKEKHQLNKQPWFEQLVMETQTLLAQQQALYNQYQSQFQQKQKPQRSSQSQNLSQSPGILNINITQLTNLKLLDEFMGKYYESAYKQTFIELYQKKIRILDALQSGKLTNDQYLMIAKKIFNQTKNDEVKKVVKSDLEMLEDLHDNRVSDWLKQAIKQTKDESKQQKQIYEMHKKGIEVNKRQKKTDIDLQAMMNIPIPEGTDPSHCISLTLIDRYMKQSKSNPPIYMALYEKKQKLLSMHDDGKLTEKIYHGMIIKMMSSITNEDLKEIYQNDLNDIEDIHEGKLKQWFENVVEESRLSLMIQQDVYAAMKKQFKSLEPSKKVQETKRVERKPEPKRQEPKIITKIQSLKTASIDPVLGYDISQMFSLKVLQNSIIAHESDSKIFAKVFAQKNIIVEMMMKKELDAQKYKKMQEKLMKQVKNDQVRDQIEFDIAAIDDDHDGDIQAWFKDVVQNAGMDYDAQMKRYEQESSNQIKSVHQKMNEESIKSDDQPDENEKPKKIVKKDEPSNVKSQLNQSKIPSPFNIQKLLSLKVIDNALTEHESNQRLYMKIFAQKQRIIKKMESQELNAEKYKVLQQKMLELFADNEEIKDMIEFDIEDIEGMYDGNVEEWFKQTVNSAGVGYENQLERYMQLEQKYGTKKEETRKDNTAFSSTASIHHQSYESPEKQLESKLSQASNQINHSTPKSKIRFYLQELAVWESLAAYYQKHNLNPSSNKLLKIYFNVSRHEIEDIIDKIKTQPGYDIVSYCKKFFPPITETVFYQGYQNIQERIQHGIKTCNKAILQLQEYIKNLRKNLNMKNIERVKEKTLQYKDHIKYLSDLSGLIKKNGKLIPLPLIEEIPVSYPNMDEYTHLEANQIELKLVKIQNLPEQQILKIHFDGKQKHSSKVHNGPSNIILKETQNAENFAKVLRGDHKSFSISMYTDGWFKKSKNGEQAVQMQFIRTNIHEGKVTIGKATIYYEARVRMAKTPLMTEIKQIKIIKFPTYEHSKKIEDDLLSKYTINSKA